MRRELLERIKEFIDYELTKEPSLIDKVRHSMEDRYQAYMMVKYNYILDIVAEHIVFYEDGEITIKGLSNKKNKKLYTFLKEFFIRRKEYGK